jgi:O-antigen ligase
MEQQRKKTQLSLWELVPLVGFVLLYGWSVYRPNPTLFSFLLFLPLLLAALYVLVFRNAWMPALLLLLVPLSVQRSVGAGIMIEFPAEAMVAIVAVVFAGQSLFYPGRYRAILSHPVVLLALASVGWMLLCSFQSNMPFVSYKRSFVKLAYLFSFMVVFADWMKKEHNRKWFFLFYIIGALYPMIHTFINHSRLGFLPITAYWMPKPFFNDHTIYGACMAFLLPAGIIFLLNRKLFGFSARAYAGIVLIFLLLLSAEVLSFSRAAWVSVVMAALFALLVKFRIRLWMIISFILVFASLVLLNQKTLTEFARQNESISSKGTLKDHLLSVTNIQTDASNVERINRWNSAVRMANEHPWFGFGPGMYQFEYGRFQLSTELTSISTFSGNRGHAHSEILGALAESGYPGMIIEVVLMFTVIGYGLNVYYSTDEPVQKQLVLAALLGLISYYVHGFFNAFLDTEKMAILVYGSIALILATDISNRKKENLTASPLPDARP